MNRLMIMGTKSTARTSRAKVGAPLVPAKATQGWNAYLLLRAIEILVLVPGTAEVRHQIARMIKRPAPREVVR